MTLELLSPDWPAPPRVKALSTTRAGGVSAGPYLSLNLGDHVGDEPAAVDMNRARLRGLLPAEPMWLRQVHGVAVADADAMWTGPVEADAAVARRGERVCAILTADCLPVLFCDRDGTVVAAAHAGWRGLLGGVLEHTLAVMGVPPDGVMAWLGPAIGPAAFEVGNEVREAFVADDPEAIVGFKAGPVSGKWWADLAGLARRRLTRSGVSATYGGAYCTYQDARRFFSYRRDGITGRMGTFIWLAAGHDGENRVGDGSY